MEKIKFTPKTVYSLEKSEFKNLYTYLALAQYSWLRFPDYYDEPLMKTLEKDFKKFCVEMQKQVERDPNNLSLNRISTFFNNHYKHIKEITKDADNEQKV